MFRVQTLCVLLLVPASLACTRSLAPADGLPNIAIVPVDDLGIGDVGCYNPASKAPMPSIDALAAAGMRFDAAYAPSAVCSPSRYALLTGRYAWRTKLQQQIVTRYDPLLIDADTPTLPGLLRARGYATACIGKWHLGFGAQQPGDFTEQRPELRPHRVDYTQPLRPGPNACGFDTFFGSAGKPGMYFMVPPEFEQDELSSWFIENERVQVGERAAWDQTQVGPILAHRAADWIERQVALEPGRPLFLYFALTAVHAPLHPAPLAQGKSAAGTYGDFVFEADWAVGQIVQALERAGIADNTLLVVTSDNGPDPSVAELGPRLGHRSNLDLRGWKRDIWEGGVRVPMLVRWPGVVAPGTHTGALASLNDLFATGAAAAGLALPADAAPDSFDLSALFSAAGRDPAGRESLVLHSASGMFALRQGPWKYVEGKGSGGNRYAQDPQVSGPDAPPGQLFNLGSDPSESRNLYRVEPERVAELSGLLARLRAQTSSRP